MIYERGLEVFMISCWDQHWSIARPVSAMLMAECFESRFCHVQYVINTGLLSFNDVIPYSLCCFLSPLPVQLPILSAVLPPYITVCFYPSTNNLLVAVRSTCLYHKSIYISYNRTFILHNIWFNYRIQNVVCLWICCQLILVLLPVIIYMSS